MNGEEHIRRAYEAILDNDFELAIDCFEQAIAVEPGNAEYHYKLSVTYARSNRLPQALRHADSAKSLEPDNESYRSHYRHLTAKLLVEQAETYFNREESQLFMAISLLKQAIELDPLSVGAYMVLALAYSGISEYGPAIAAVKEALRLDPANENALTLHSELENTLNQYLYTTKDK